ncbi:hypothetical protein M8818_000106 [Zalaria obscura]|uniref:Uncharacterized protein n=1 Tax=Zalaria obscura TaxID=2024903 RepID=A0ACC3SQ68_9PEZI
MQNFSLLLLALTGLVQSVPAPSKHTLDQRPLIAPPQVVAADLQPPTRNLDMRPNSVEILFTSSDDDEMTRVWLPLGQKIRAGTEQEEVANALPVLSQAPGDIPVLPLHPISAIIANVINDRPSSPEEARLDKVTCVVRPAAKKLSKKPSVLEFVEWTEMGVRNERPLRFRGPDGRVDFENPKDRWFLGGREVESVECF